MSDTQPMKRSWLVQRLNKPRAFGPLGVDNPFSFGGGLRNGGLTDEAMSLLRGVFSFDYMGAAEFEFGAVPKALQALAKADRDLAVASFTIALADVEPDWRDRNAAPPDGEETVYTLGRRKQLPEIEQRVRQWAAKDHTLKESTRLPRTLWPANEWDGETLGWLELDNGFFFFADRDMWEQTCALFGVKVPAVTA